YYLLAGHAPFLGPSSSPRSRQELEPKPLEIFRRDVPPAVSAVIRTLLAHRPEDRYQTPAEVVAALAPSELGKQLIVPPAPRPSKPAWLPSWLPAWIAFKPRLWLLGAGLAVILILALYLVALLLRSPASRSSENLSKPDGVATGGSRASVLAQYVKKPTREE